MTGLQDLYVVPGRRMGEGAGAGVGFGAVRLVGLRYGVGPYGVEGTRRV